MKKSLRLLTLIFFSFALPVFFCAPIFCDTWSWTGGDSENNWAYGPPWRNETTGEEGTILTGHPDGADDIAYISGDCEIELKGPLAEYDITLNELRFQTYTGAAYKTSSWTATIKGSKTLTFNLMELDRAATLAGVTGTLKFNCPTVCKGKIITHSDTTFTATKPITLAADSEITAIGNGAITISELAGTKTATLFCGTDDYMEISAYNTTDVPSIVVAANSKSVSLGGGTIAGLTVNSNAAATVTSGMTVDGDLVVDGELTIAGDLTVTGTLTITGSGKLTVNGDLDVTGDTKNEGTITTNAGATFSSLLIDGGSLVNAGSGNVTATTLEIGSNDANITNSSTGSITAGTLTGAYTANLDNSSSGSITVSNYGAGANAPKIVLAASSQNVSLAGGTIAALTLGSSAQANITGDLTVTGTTSNSGTITATGDIAFGGAVTGASGTITSSNISVGAATASNLGTVEMTAATSITNNGDGKVTVTKLSGAETATLTNGATAGGIAISGYDESAIPSVKVASDNVSLDGGTIAALTVNASVTATVSGNLTVTGATTNNGTIAAGANTVTFNGAVTSGASAGITTTTGKIITKTASGLGTVTVQSAGGSVEHAGSGAVTVTELVMDANASVTSSSTGAITLSKITGGNTATLSSETGSITVSAYDTTNVPKIVLAADSQNVSLAGGTIAALTVAAGAQADATGNLTVSGATTNNGTINAGTNSLTFNGAVTGASGTIKSTSITVGATTASDLGTVEMTAATSITNSGAGSTTVTKLTGNKTATLNASSGSITVSGYDAAPTIIASSQNISLGAGTIAALTVDGASDKATITGNLTVTGNITNYGTLDASAATITMTGASPTLTGNGPAENTKIKDLVVNGADVTLTIDGAHKITGTLDLKGTENHPLTIEGSGSITLPSTQDGGQYLSVARGGVKIGDGSGSGNFYNATDSSFSSGIPYGMNNNWIILNPLMEFVWTGATSEDWGTASNWNYILVPGLASATGGVDTRDYPVTIPDSPSGGNFPVAAAAYTVKSLQVGQAASSSATLKLSSASNIATTAASAALSNYGTITYSSAGRITDGTGTFINDAANGGTVEFASASGASDLATPSYYNLIVSGSGAFLSAEDKTLTVKNDMTYDASGTLTISALSVTNDLKILAGNVKFNASDVINVGTETKAKTVTLSTSGSVSVGNNGADRFNVTGGALSFPSTLGDLELCGKITARDGITLSKDATLKGNVEFESDTTLGADVNLIIADDHSSMQTATINAKLNCAGHTLTLKNASLTNNGAVTDGNINFIETAARAQSFTPDTGSTYAKVTVNKTSGGSLEIMKALKATEFAITENKTFTADAAFTAEKLAITKNTTATFKGLVTVSSEYSDAGTAGNISFTAGCNFTPAATFTTTGIVTLNGSSTACNFAGGLTHITGSTSISGALTTENNKDISLAATTLAAAATIDAGAGAVTINGSLDGLFAFASNGTGTLTLAGAVGTTNPPATITVEGQTIISAPSVTTSGLQNYKKDVTFDAANCTVTGQVKADAKLIVNAGKAASLSSATTVAGDINNNGTLAATGNLTFESNFIGGSGTFSSTATVTATGAAATFTANTTAKSKSITNFVYAPTAANPSLTITDGNTFKNFTCQKGGATLNINAAQKITNDLTLKGISGSPITVAGSGSLNITKDEHIGDYLKINRDQVSITGGYYYIADNSEFASASATDPKYGQHNGWIIMNPALSFNWTGDTDTAWGKTTNWDCGLIPGTDQPIEDHTFGTNIVSTKGYPVTITTKPNQPATAATAYSVGQLTIDDATATLTLESASVSVVKIDGVSDTADGTLANKGTIVYSAAGRITDGTNFINDATQGTVEFTASGAGASATTDLADVTTTTPDYKYYNLTISGSGDFKANGALTVKNDLIVSKTSTAATGSVWFNASDDATTTTANTVRFNTTGKISLGNNAGDKFEVTGGALSLPAASDSLGSLTLAGTISAGGTGITLSKDAALAANTTFASATSLGAPVNLTASSALTVKTNAKLTTTSTNTLTLTNASLTNAAEVAGGNIIFAETTLKPHQVFTPNTASTYQSVTINKTSGGEFTVNQTLNATDFTVTKNGTLTTSAAVNATNFTINDNNVYVANAAVTAASLAITKNTNATFNELVTVTTAYHDAPAAGNITFAKGCAFTPATTFATTGTLTLNGATNACAFTGGLTHTDGPTVLSGDLTTTNAAIILGKTSPDITTTLAADTTINAGSEDISVNGTLNGAFQLTSSGTNVTFNGAIGNSASPTQLTSTGATTLNGTTKIAGPISITGSATINAATTTTNSGNISITGTAAINANTTSAATITVTGQTTVTAASITTPTDSTGLQHYKDNLAFNSNCTVTGTVQAAANVATSGAAKATFNNDLWLYTNAGNAKDSTLGGGSASPSLDIKGNLFIAKSGRAATVASAVSSAKNILLLHGTLNVNAALSSTQDIILLGANYNINDAASGVNGLFAYKHASRKRAASYTDPFPTACPDGTAISQPWSGAVATTAGATISAGQNFYANGLSSLGSGAWTLLLKDNNKQTDAFAEIYNSTITNCSANHNVAAAENVTATGCTNITTTRPVIFEAYTVYDDVVYITFKDSAGNAVTIENSGNEISAAAANIRNSDEVYAATYMDADCQTSTNGKGDVAGGFYIKSSNKWNTDANGISAGATQSSDRGSTGALPTHRTTIPYLNLPKALASVYETLRDSSKNRIAHYGDGHIYTAVADKCAPVLIKVLTGQEMHEDPTNQKDYDAHNFVEFVYSEPVDISSVSGATSVAESAVNVQAAADLGNATGTAGITFAGLGKSAGGNIEAALKSGSGSPHALYRNFSTTAGDPAANQAARIRVSIAGWVDGTVAGSYKNWAGYISSADTPSGNITRIANANIKDKSPAQNSLDANPSRPNHALPTLSVQTSDGAANELYGTWDVTPPSFAPVRINGTTTWAIPHYDGSQEFEYVGASYGTGTLSAIEVHWFDNQPAYSENRQWFSRVGWADASSPTQYSTIVSYAADVRGGSRPDIGSAVTSANATVGGIRYCSLYNAYNAFKYSVVGSGTYHDFTQTIQGGAESSLFTYAGTATGTHTTGAEDGLYCKLRLDDTTLQPNTTFLMQFDSDACCITDLAGNRIQCGNITMKSVDRTPPEYLMTAVPIGTKQMLIIFSKELNVDTLTLYNDATHHTDVSALRYIPQALELTGGSGTIAIDQSVPATCVFRNNKSTGIVVTLSRNAVLNDITGRILVNAIGVNKYDPLAGIPATITYIQDSIGNYLVPAKKHALSDFAVNAVNPQYAYDNTLTDGGVSTDYSLYQEGAWAVRDWNAEQNNYGTLSAAKEYIMQTTLYDGTNDNTGGAADFLGTSPTQTITSFFDSAPDANSVSTKINENTRLSWRIWHPNSTPDYVFTSLATINNVPQFNLEGSANDSGVVFDIPQSVSSAKWKSGDQVSFLFKMGNYTVDHFDDGRPFPLYAVRLKDPSDITSLDLWSFKIKTTNLQRGGVSILNNVIDLNTGEHTVIQVDMKQSGNLNVIVMTLDGNIVTYLRHGQTDAGTHYYNWNGTNNGGSKVARGLYFVRVIGPGIDETRKVMCVK